jgi:amidase
MLEEAFLTIWAAGVPWGIDGIGRLTGRQPSPDKFEPLTWALYEQGKQTMAGDYLIAVSTIQQMCRTVAHSSERYDLWLTPTLGAPPPRLGHFDPTPDNPKAGLEKAIEFVPFTPLQNATGQPAMSVPLYWNAAGLPIGVHFAARFGDEATLFRLAAQLEEARPWANKRPPVSAA